MTNPIGNRKTLWAECFPEELRKIIRECPIVYLPMGLCEPHGQVSALGLDTIKAEYLCQAAPVRFGGIVAPSMGYHIHECGANAAWLEQEVGNENPHMTSLPPHIVLYFFLYQLRAFANAGFKGIIVHTGHSSSENDLRHAAEVFMRLVPVQILVGSDFELSGEGDHAGNYEISQLMYMRPELIDMKRRSRDSVVMGTRKKRSVEQASEMLKRLYYVEREIMRTLGGYLVSVSDWSLKKALPFHLKETAREVRCSRNVSKPSPCSKLNMNHS